MNQAMRKNLLLYIAAIVTVMTVLLLFSREYRGLTGFAELSNRHNQVYTSFYRLQMHISNAAFSNPQLVKTGSQDLFYADSISITEELNRLRDITRDSTNMAIAKELQKAVLAQLPWLLQSDVMDSLQHHKAAAHISSLRHINSLIGKGISRTSYLIEERKRQLQTQTGTLKLSITLFILLSISLLFYITYNLFRQQLKRKNKERELEVFLNRIQDAVIMVDHKWCYTFLNDKALANHALDKMDILGKSLWQVHPELLETVFWDIYQQAMQSGKAKEIEDYYSPTDTWFTVKIYPSPEGLTIFYRDITESKKAELHLLQSLQEVNDYKFALDQSSIVAITDHRGIIHHVNENFCKISGYSSSELTGQDHRIINSGYHAKDYIKGLWRTIAAGNIWKGELKNRAKDGSTYWVDTTIVPFLNKQGKPYQYIAIRSDITERKKLEAQLALSDSIVNYSHDAILSKTLGGIITSWNKGAENIFGYTAADIIGKHIATIIPTYYWSQEYEIMEKIRAGLVIDHYETQRIKKDGTLIQVSLTISPLKDAAGNITGASKIVRDISKQKKAEQEITRLNASLEKKVLERTNELLEARDKLAETLQQAIFSATIANNIQDPVVASDNVGKITHWNNAAEKLLGWTSEEVIGKTTTEILKGDYLQTTREAIIQSLKEKNYWQGEVIYYSKSGRQVNALITASQIKDTAGNITGNLALVRDITERKKAEQKLQEFEHFFNNSNDFSCIANTQGYFEIVNASFNKILGYTMNELALKPFIDFVHPDDIPETLAAYEELKQGATVIHFINRYRKKDGSYLWFDWNASPNPITGKLYCIARDITESRQAQEALSKSIEELEAFSYSVSHDLRAPLRGIIGFTNILEEDYANQLDEEARRITSVIKQNALKMGSLIDDLLTFSRLGRQQITKTKINSEQIVKEAIKETDQRPGISRVHWILHPLPQVLADVNTIRQVWINLISNAIKYSCKKQQPVIEIGAIDEENETIFFVKDNGVGFDEKYRDKLFRVFQRLHSAAEFEGTGVGLAIVQRIVSKHGGRAWATGITGQGASFFFSLPGEHIFLKKEQ